MQGLVRDVTATIEVHHGSVTDADVDVLVNASNTILQLGSGVSGAIRVACGRDYQPFLDAVLQQHGGGLEPGACIVTHAGAHPRALWIAHVAVMDYRDPPLHGPPLRVGPDAARIERASVNLWRALEGIATERLSVGMVALGAGTGNLGVRVPTQIACSTLREHFRDHPHSKLARVIFHGFTGGEFADVKAVVSAASPLVG